MIETTYKLQNDDPSKCPCCGNKPTMLVLPCDQLPINVCHGSFALLVSNGGVECVRELDSNFNPTEPLPDD